MKKRKPLITPALLPNKKKEMLKLVNNPEQLQKVMSFIQASSDLFDKSKTVKALNMMDWVERCIMILPDDMEGKDGFILAFKSFVDNYGESDNGISTQG
ncbi:MAG: hypothetical protein J6T74_07135 [Clostridia bacterium]|nr:hypothetical protein [Clostridia bacterium]